MVKWKPLKLILPKRPVKNTVDQQRSWCQRQPQGLLLYSLDLLEKLDISDSHLNVLGKCQFSLHRVNLVKGYDLI